VKIIRTAIIGSGFMGSAHTEALCRIGGVKISAIVSDDQTRAQEIAHQYSIPSVYSDWNEMIKDDTIEVVHNCTPNSLHFEINKAIIQSGKHVLSEKPLTLTSAESEELLKLLRPTKLVHAINYNYRMLPLIQEARARIGNGEIGDLFLAHGQYLQDWLQYDTDFNWRLETELGGESRAIADIGSHWCDLIQFITSRKIIAVNAQLVTIHKQRKKPKTRVETFQDSREGATETVKINTEDAGSVLLKFEGGLTGTLMVSQVSAGRKNRLWFEIDGSEASLTWNQETPNQLLIGKRNQANELLLKDPGLLGNEARRFAHFPGGHPEGYPDGLKNLFIEFYNFIRSGGNPIRYQPVSPTFLMDTRKTLLWKLF